MCLILLKTVPYVFGVPDVVGQLFADGRDEVEDQDDQEDDGTEEPPRELPEDVGLVSHHELDVFIKPEDKQQRYLSPQCLRTLDTYWRKLAYTVYYVHLSKGDKR